MYRILTASKDTYITNKIINNDFRATDANVGRAGTLDLFKLFDESDISGESKPKELTRVLVKFDLNPLRQLTGSILDYTDPSFKCNVKMFDVMGGQTLPSNFKLILFPLSKSFDEGIGKDVVKFQDLDAANFITSSISGDTAVTWNITGANAQGLLGSSNIDIISSGNLSDGNGVANLWKEQLFSNGTEDLCIDVTTLVSATLSSQIPDHGFRISFSGTQETDEKTRFVKRFSSRHSSNRNVTPRLEVMFDDSIQDHHESFFFDSTGSIFLNNKIRGRLKNIVSGSSLTEIKGNNSLLVKVSTGSYNKIITGSQFSRSTNFVTGVYSASFAIWSGDNSVVNTGTYGSVSLSDYVRDSGSITFTTFWQSLDSTVGFFTGSLKINRQNTSGFTNVDPVLSWNISNLNASYKVGNKARIRVVAFDIGEPVVVHKVPLERKSKIYTSAYYRIRDAYSHDVVIPFETSKNATLLSTDSDGMYFDIFTDDFPIGRSFVIDILLKDSGVDRVFEKIGGSFRIDP
tara:strand:- start:15544 stop:17094 length:1551 start_codon:yes stop_codon:yes gene_type:complete